ncbi:MAG TPA: hypothetical protein ENI89_02150 [Desulfobulbus sp.]|nr:hypothetical protein [Desulfobulbus sp.]
MATDSQGLMIRLGRLLLANRWGGQALVCLQVSVLSGILLALQYDVAEPYYSTATIELVIPYGAFWRALHYYSSQGFLLLLLCHLAVILWKGEYTYTRPAWVRLTTTVPVALLLMFTGYVLRGDATGEAAGAIAEHIARSIPLLGDLLNQVLFDVSASGARRIYVNHLAGLVALGGFCAWPHLRRYTARWQDHLLLLMLLPALSILVAAPMEPDHVGLLHIGGPWFFLGLQELLRYLPVFWAGVVAPATIILALLALPDGEQRRRRWLFFVCAWLAVYCVLCIISYWRI